MTTTGRLFKTYTRQRGLVLFIFLVAGGRVAHSHPSDHAGNPTSSVVQAGITCSYSGTGGVFTFSASGGDSGISISAPTECPWSASSTVPWIVITSNQASSGNNSVTYRVAPNPSNPSRTGQITIAGTNYVISEAGATGCFFTLDAPGATVQPGGGTVTVHVSASASSCAWTATGNAWATLTSGASGQGNGTVTLAVPPNLIELSRWTPVNIAGQQFIVTQTQPYAFGRSRFVTVPPCRLIDTRTNSGFSGQFGPPFLLAETPRNFALAASNCNIPGDAHAYSLNITVIPLQPLGFLTAWATGQPQPFVSTLNSEDGRVVANAAIVQAGAGGAISLYTSDASDVVVDVNGYFVDTDRGDNAVLAFYPVTPCRLVDTRSSVGVLGGPSMTGSGSARDFPFSVSPCAGFSDVEAYSLNVTVVPKGSLSFLTAWPSGAPQPTVSTLNSIQGEVVANAAIVPAGANGGISVFTLMSSLDSTDVIIDLNGFFTHAYFATPSTVGTTTFVPVTPCRAVDTRAGQGTSGEFGPPSMPSGGATRTFTLPATSCGVPASARAYSLNITVVPTGPLNYLTTWPTGQPQPVASTLNSLSGKALANAAIVPAGLNGAISVFTLSPSGSSTDVIIDVNGYFEQIYPGSPHF